MEAIFERPILVESSIKKMLIDQFLKRENISPSYPSPIIKNPIKPLEKVVSRSQSSFSLPLSKQFFSNSRTSSICSSRSITATSQCLDPDIPKTLLTAVNSISLKKVQNLQKAGKDENSLCLVYSFLTILADSNALEMAAGKKIMRSNVWHTFSAYISKPGIFVQGVRKIPNLIKTMKICEMDVKKALALFNIVDGKRLGPFKMIYDVVKEGLAYAGEVYGIKILFRSVFRTSSVKGISKNVEKIGGKVRNVSVGETFINVLAEKVVNISEVLMENEEKVCEYQKSPENHGRVDSLPTQDEVLKKLLENPLSLFKTHGKGQEKSCKNLKQTIKTQRFLVDSRVNRRIHEKLIKFLSKGKKAQGLDNASTSEKTQKVMDEFISTLSCSEVSSSTLKYLEYISSTKEFLRLMTHYYNF